MKEQTKEILGAIAGIAIAVVVGFSVAILLVNYQHSQYIN